MNYGHLLAAALLAAAPTRNARDLAPAPAAPTVVSSPAEPAATVNPAVGDSAPDFMYQSRDYLWQHLRNLLEQGSVLLVFGATDDALRTLEREREELLHCGVIPVAVVGARESDVWRIVRRNDLTYSLLSDPHAVIAGQYGALDRAGRAPRPVWFVIDHAGRVRATGEGVSPGRDWTATAVTALGLSDVHEASAH